MSVTEIVVASRNKKKLAELQAMLASFPVRILSIDDVRPDVSAPEETGVTFHENSALKALYYAAACNRPCIADDSGIEVDALDGRPGVWSSSFGGEEGNDRKNNETLLRQLSGIPPEGRGAQFHCVITVANRGRVLLVTEGICRGIVVDEARGAGGFGYDPHFFHPELRKTFAELTREEKAAVSHRGKALEALRERLPQLLGDLATAENR